ncbi:MAG: carboxypeptidase-like regulatory domain-containing protein [Desulfuromonadales bacterium]|nr:carboxypeptidase-like regulatory domain-containing protein [Desulfuromonadales bacterium]
MNWSRILLGCGLLCLLCANAFAESGVRGRVAWRGELFADVTVRAYRQIADIAAGEAVGISAPTDLDGIYQLDLPPGNYVLTAGNSSGAVKPGDLFCYYSGSPIQVPEDGYRNVGFNLIRVPAEKPAEQVERSGIYGQLTYQDELLQQAYLYVYKDPGKGFKGPGYFIQPVANGTFRLNLPPGDYYLLARKRERGGQFGPIEIGDYFNYYYGNPLHIEAGQLHEVKIEMVTRLSMLEEEVVALRGLSGQVVDVAGTPQAGLYVFAYRHAEMIGTPDFFSTPTGADGRFELALPDAGPYYLLARQAFGGPAGRNELYGKLQKSAGTPLAVAVSGQKTEVVIHVAPKATD